MSRVEATTHLATVIDFEPAYYLSSIPVHVVEPDHWLARHRAELDPATVVVIDARDEPSLWRAISDADTRHGRPPRMAVVVSSPSAPLGGPG